jgi:hypothetical protein
MWDMTTKSQLIAPGLLNDALGHPATNKIWKAFGLERHNATLWNNTGSRTRPDIATDADIVAALTSGGENTKSATLRLLSSRLRFTSFPTGDRFALVQTTGATVGGFMLSHGVLRNPDPAQRAMAIKAAATIPTFADKLFPEILAAVAEHQTDEVLASGALAAAMFGPSYAQAFIERFKQSVSRLIRSPGISRDTLGVFAAVAVAPNHEATVLELLSESDSIADTYQREMRGVNARRAIAYLRPIPPAVAEQIKKRCGSLNRVTSTMRERRNCSGLLARAGDELGFSDLKAMLTDPSLEDWDRREAALLLLDAGDAGITTVRQVALLGSSKPAKAAVEALCELGHRVVDSRIMERAQAISSEVGTQWLIGSCMEREPTDRGRAVLQPNVHPSVH